MTTSSVTTRRRPPRRRIGALLGCPVLISAAVPAAMAAADAPSDFDVVELEIAAPAAGTADLVEVQGIPGVELDVLANGESLIRDFSYEDLEYFEGVEPATYTFEVVVGETVLSRVVDLEVDTSYSLAATPTSRTA